MDTAAINVQNSLLVIKKGHQSSPKGLKQTDCGATPREAKFHKIPNQRRLDHRPTLRTGLCLPYSAMPPKKVTDEWSRVGKTSARAIFQTDYVDFLQTLLFAFCWEIYMFGPIG